MCNATARRNYLIDMLKFIFSVYIFLFHFFNGDLFEKGYLCVDFFFIISGIMIANTHAKNDIQTDNVFEITLHQIKKKISSFALPYYLAWIIIFLQLHRSSELKEIISDFLGSVFELLFLRMVGFKIYLCNGVTWYISALLIAMFICLPIYYKWKKMYIMYLGPIITAFFYMLLDQYEKNGCINYWVQSYADGLPYLGLLRAIAGINLGLIGYEIIPYIKKQIKKNLSNLFGIVILLLVWGGIFAYMFYPTHQYYDYQILFLGFVGILGIIVENDVLRNPNNYVYNSCLHLGQLSLYIYLFQNVVLIYRPKIYSFFNVDQKSGWIICLIVLFVISEGVMLFVKKIKKRYY